MEQIFPTTTLLEAFSTHFCGRKDRFPTTGSIHRDKSSVQSRAQNSLLQIVSNAGSSGQSELSVDTSKAWSFNDLENFDPAQYYGSTDMSTTPSMTTPSIEDGTAHNPIVLTDEAPVNTISVRPTESPAIVERVRPFGNEIQNLTEYVVRTFLNKFDIVNVMLEFF